MNLLAVTYQDFSIADYAVMLGYLIFVVVLGIIFSGKEKDTEDYFLGGRKMPTYVIAVSMFVTLFSAITFVAVPGEAYQHGLSFAFGIIFMPLGILLGFSLFVKFYFKLTNIFTPFGYLEARYNRTVRLIISLVFMLMRLLYLGMVMYASAKAFKGAAGWPIWATILIVGVVGIFYTTLGGMKAVVWTDFVQFIILLVGIAFVFIELTTKSEGGLFGLIKYALENERGFEAQKSISFLSVSPFERYTIWIILISMISNYTFYYGADQMTIQRLLSTPSYKHAKRATLTNAIMTIPILAIFWIIGLGLFSYYRVGSGNDLPEGIHANEVFSYFIITALPAPIPGLLMAALLAAVMSTIDSGMNSLSAVFVKDIYVPFINPKASTHKEMAVSKIVTVIWGVFFIGFGLIKKGYPALFSKSPASGAHCLVLSPVHFSLGSLPAALTRLLFTLLLPPLLSL